MSQNETCTRTRQRAARDCLVMGPVGTREVVSLWGTARLSRYGDARDCLVVGHVTLRDKVTRTRARRGGAGFRLVFRQSLNSGIRRVTPPLGSFYLPSAHIRPQARNGRRLFRLYSRSFICRPLVDNVGNAHTVVAVFDDVGSASVCLSLCLHPLPPFVQCRRLRIRSATVSVVEESRPVAIT